MSEKLTMSDRLVLLAMCSRLSASRLDRYVWPLVEALVKMTTLSERSIYRSQAKLERLKFIHWVTNPELIPSGGRELPTPPPGAWEIAELAGTEMDEWKGIFLNTARMKQFWAGAPRFVDGPRLLVLLALVVRLNPADNQVWGGLTRLRMMTGLHRDTVRPALKELEAIGLISRPTKFSLRAPVNDRKNVYELVLPEHYSSRQSTDTDRQSTDTDRHITEEGTEEGTDHKGPPAGREGSSKESSSSKDLSTHALATEVAKALDAKFKPITQTPIKPLRYWVSDLKKEGMTSEEILAMVHRLCIVSRVDSGTPPWQQFVSEREDLAKRAKATVAMHGPEDRPEPKEGSMRANPAVAVVTDLVGRHGL